MKYLLYGFIALLTFAAALAGTLAASGNLNAESLEKILALSAGPEESSEETLPTDEEDPLSSLAQALKAREQTLEKRAETLEEREKELDKRETELRTLDNTVQQRIKELNTLLSDSDNEREARRKTTALTLEEMDPTKAAERLTGLAPEEAVAILRLVDDKERAKILEEMTPEEATRLLRMFQEPPL